MLKNLNRLISIFQSITFFLLLPVFSFAQINLPSSLPDRVILNVPGSDPSTSVAVTWRTNTSVKEGFCEIQPSSGFRINPEISTVVKAETRTFSYSYPEEPEVWANQHSVVLKGLQPDGKYVYRVGDKTNWSEWFEFQVPAKDEEKYSFIYFGDPQVGLRSEWSRVVRNAYKFCPNSRFMLYAGDIINRVGRDYEWYEWFDAGSFIFSSVPQVLTPGNHDYDDTVLGTHWNAQFTQPTNGPAGLDGTCFYIDYPHLKLISIDSAVNSELEDEDGAALTSQKMWLDSVLSKNTKEWVVLTTHLPFYSTSTRRDNPQLRKHFQPILEKYQVDLVLTGHDHSYGRGRVSDNPAVKKPSIVYVVSVSGPKLSSFEKKAWTEKSGEKLQLFQVISIDKNEMHYQSVMANGGIFDEFKIKRKDNGKKTFVDMQPKDGNLNID